VRVTLTENANPLIRSARSDVRNGRKEPTKANPGFISL